MFENFGKPQPKNPEVVDQDTHEAVGEVLSAQDILEQLNGSEDRYDEAFQNLKEGDEADLEFLEEMQVTLRDFKYTLDNDMEIDLQSEAASSWVNERLGVLSELFEKRETDKEKRKKEEEILH